MNNVITETIEPIWGHSYRYEINGNIPRDGVNPLGDLVQTQCVSMKRRI